MTESCGFPGQTTRNPVHDVVMAVSSNLPIGDQDVTRLLLMAICLLWLPAKADRVELTLPNQLVARAEFREGHPGKPAVVLMHGFLQTHDFPVIHRLTEHLGGAGYTVLAPTLTLGISARRQSLACEALHTHTQEDAIRELDAWMKWLKARRVQSVILIGHSFGSMQALAYTAEMHNPMVKKLIGISIIEGRPIGRNGKEVLPARGNGKSDGIVTQAFSFCQKFRASPSTLESYLAWTPRRILNEVDRSRLPITFIMGDRDDRLGPHWIAQLQKTRAKVRIIPGANHFMDGEYEFDLLDRVSEELKGL